MRLLIIILLSFSSLLTAQTALHFDRPFHVAGEVAWFSAFLPQPAPPKVKVSIYGPDGTMLDYFFLGSGPDGQAAGYYRWPFTLPTGYYRLGLEGMTTEKEVIDLGVFTHAVFSDQRVTETEGGTLLGADPLPGATDLKVAVSGQQVSITGLREDAYSISIVNEDVTGPANPYVEVPAVADYRWADTLFYPATVSTAAGEPLSTNLLPVWDPATFSFGFAKASNGDFLLELGAFEGTKTVQVRATDGTDLQPRLAERQLSPLTGEPPVTAEVAAYIDLARRRRKIYQLFATVETEIAAQARPQERQSLAPNRDFQVQDYKKFPDMYNFFKEVAGELRVRTKKDNYTGRLYNAPNQRFFLETPLYIIDGKLTRDDNYVMKMNPAGVEYLAFYYVGSELRRYFPALGNHGVVQIETLRPPTKFPAADADDIFPVRGIQPAATFPVRDAAASEVPALSPVLVWKTGVATGSDVTLRLPDTDDYGNYRIVVVARSKEGRLRSFSQNFVQRVK